ncbi:MAG: serine--tRNA ligase, partial [Bacilli bacterium]
MIDIKLIRENKELVKQNIKNKFQDKKLPLVDEIYKEDIEYRKVKTQLDELRNEKNKASSQIGLYLKEKSFDMVENAKSKVSDINKKIPLLEEKEKSLE